MQLAISPASLLLPILYAVHAPLVNGLLLDIHIPLKPDSSQACVYEEALRWNLGLQKEDDEDNENEGSFEYIDFLSQHTPHVTLYLADFDVENEDPTSNSNDLESNVNQTKLELLTETIQDTISDIAFDVFEKQFIYTNFEYPCTMQISKPHVSSAYTMLDVQNNECLQYLSDSIVESTMSFVKFPATIPDWVNAIPDPETREMKIKMIETYGSPNVFEGFEPHVTVAYEKNFNTDNVYWRDFVVEELTWLLPTECEQTIDFMALGYTSMGGTVLHDPIVEENMLLFETDDIENVLLFETDDFEKILLFETDDFDVTTSTISES